MVKRAVEEATKKPTEPQRVARALEKQAQIARGCFDGWWLTKGRSRSLVSFIQLVRHA